jgi:centromere protein X
MPPQKAAGGASNRGRPKGSKAAAPVVIEAETDDPFASSDDESAPTNQARNGREKDADDMEDLPQARVEEEEETPEKTIPKELLTRLLHEFFTKDSTRISRDANATVGKYFDVFVREAIARTAVEKQGGFLEVSCLSLMLGYLWLIC